MKSGFIISRSTKSLLQDQRKVSSKGPTMEHNWKNYTHRPLSCSMQKDWQSKEALDWSWWHRTVAKQITAAWQMSGTARMCAERITLCKCPRGQVFIPNDRMMGPALSLIRFHIFYCWWFIGGRWRHQGKRAGRSDDDFSLCPADPFSTSHPNSSPLLNKFKQIYYSFILIYFIII